MFCISSSSYQNGGYGRYSIWHKKRSVCFAGSDRPNACWLCPRRYTGFRNSLVRNRVVRSSLVRNRVVRSSLVRNRVVRSNLARSNLARSSGRLSDSNDTSQAHRSLQCGMRSRRLRPRYNHSRAVPDFSCCYSAEPSRRQTALAPSRVSYHQRNLHRRQKRPFELRPPGPRLHPNKLHAEQTQRIPGWPVSLHNTPCQRAKETVVLLRDP